MDEQKISILVLMNMSKAFDSINHNMLLFILRSLGVSPSALEWFKSYLKGRYQYVRIGDVVLQSLLVDYIWSSTGAHSWPCSVYFLYKWFFNPFAPELPVTAHAGPRASTSCDIISFNGQGQLCPLTCAEWRDPSNHTRMSTIQSRTPEKKAKNHVTLTWKFPWKSCFTTHLPLLPSNSNFCTFQKLIEKQETT